MTNTPTTPTRGGKREGAGRPKKPGTQRLIAIRCTDEVYQRIVENTTPEERALILFFNINDKGGE